MLKGVATSSTQIEGNITNNWSKFASENNLNLDSIEHYDIYKEDIDLIAQLNVDCYRFSFEWSRIQPSINEIDYEVIKRYKDEVKYILSKGIRPLLTIHHFSNPIWFEELGGFTNKKSINIFIKYVEIILDNFGEYINEFVVFNEPNVYVQLSFLRGIWPPFDKSIVNTYKVLNNMSMAYHQAYKMIHDYNTNALVSISINLKPFMPLDNSYIDKKACKLYEYIYNDYVINKFLTKKDYDYIGVNYYTRTLIHKLKPYHLKDVDGMGWEIYPEGLKYVVDKVSKYNTNIWITENGLCTNDDKLRIKYIEDHLSQLDQRVSRYYYWSAFDNFEWIEGTNKRFGLIHVDYKNQVRSMKASGNYYKDL